MGQFFLLIFALGWWACVDRLSYDIGAPNAYPVVVDGFISDQPGPYQVTVSRSFDIESKDSPKINISARSVVISSSAGEREELEQITQGIYRTSPSGIQGVVGRSYQLHITLLDGRSYVSRPDTLRPSGQVDRVYFSFVTRYDELGAVHYGFNVYFDASTSNDDATEFLWRFVGTYRADITCCACYAFLRNPVPLVSDMQLTSTGAFKNVAGGYVPVTGWTFMHKVHARIEQLSLSSQAYGFWKAVSAQKLATNSLFQPISGRIPTMFDQLVGSEQPLQGIFYATSITSNGVFIHRSDLPNEGMIPKLSLTPAGPNYDPASRGCIDLFPGSTTVPPSYWVD